VKTVVVLLMMTCCYFVVVDIDIYVQAPPAVPEARMTGWRFAAGDDEGLAAALVQLLSTPDATRRAIGRRGREWVAGHCAPATVASQMLAVYAAVTEKAAGHR